MSEVLTSADAVLDDSKRASVDPDGASNIDENGGSTPNALSPKSATSPRNFRIATEDGDDTVMTETEVSHLVNKALRRARKSTSPRKSPKSTSFDESFAAATGSRLEPVAKSPQRETDYATMPQPPHSPCDDFHDLLALSNDSISLVPKSSLDESVGGSTSSRTHMSASDAIIRRVEEEIANARKAAEAASLRLTSALVSGTRESASIHDWRSSNDPRDWEQQDAAVITMRPSMDINDILNDHLADDDEFRVDLNSSFAADENSAYYRYTDNDTTNRDAEFAAKNAAVSEPDQEEQNSKREHKEDGAFVSAFPADHLPADDEKKYHEGQAKGMLAAELEAKIGETIVVDGATNKVDVPKRNVDVSIGQAIETAATGEVSLLSSVGVQVSETTGETTEDQAIHKNSAGTSGDVSSCVEDFGAESYETAEEDLPFPMDADKGTPKTDEETSPTKGSPEAGSQQQNQVDKVPTDGPNPNSIDRSHPAIGSEIFLSSQNMDSAVSQVGNDDASEYTEETISDEESDYTEVTIPDDAGATSGKTNDQNNNVARAEDSVLDRDILVPTEAVPLPTAAEKSETSPSPVEEEQNSLQVTVEQPIPQEAKTASLESAETKTNNVIDKLENARKEVDRPSKVAATTPDAPHPATAKATARRVTLSIVTESVEAEKKTAKFREDQLKPVKEEKQKRSRVIFRAPYPSPPPFPRKRTSEEIIEEYREPIPDSSSIWLRPKQELKQLLLAVTGTSLPRRSNACGALKVLSMKMKKNKLTLVKTDGFLSALVYAIREDIPIKDREIALDARARAVSTVLNVVEPKENRTTVFQYPGLPEALVKVITEDRGEARVHACQTMVMLAKTPACRELMPKVEGLIDVLAKVVQKTIDNNTDGQVEEEEEKKDDSYDDEDGHHGSSSFSDDGSTDRSDDDESHTEGESSDESSAPPNGTAAARLQSIRKKKKDQLSEFFAQARMSACAALSHLSKHCSISVSWRHQRGIDWLD